MLSRRTFLGAAAALATRAGAQPAPLQVDDSGRPTDPPPPGYYSYRGTSGPGVAATPANLGGGWVSGAPGLRYRGPHAMPFETLPWNDAATGAAVRAGLIPPLRPLMDLHIRDPQICLGGDGAYYMTGSTGDNIWKLNDGVELWRSADLARWDYLGLVWSIERDGVWEKQWRMRAGVPFRALWAPEIHFIKGNYFICHSMSRSGLAILRSTTGRPEGPYVHAFSPEAPLRRGIDSTLFEDEDGAVYFHLRLGRRDRPAARRSRRLCRGLAADHVRHAGPQSGAPSRAMRTARLYRPRLRRRRSLQTQRPLSPLRRRPFRGPLFVRRHGVGDHPRPVPRRYESVPCGGGGNFFHDHDGLWWSTFFGNDEQCSFREMPSIVKVDFDATAASGSCPTSPSSAMDRRGFLAARSPSFLPAPTLRRTASFRLDQHARRIAWARAPRHQSGLDGPGSLRAAISAAGPRTIVFDVGGTIDLGGASCASPRRSSPSPAKARRGRESP